YKAKQKQSARRENHMVDASANGGSGMTDTENGQERAHHENDHTEADQDDVGRGVFAAKARDHDKEGKQGNAPGRQSEDKAKQALAQMSSFFCRQRIPHLQRSSDTGHAPGLVLPARAADPAHVVAAALAGGLRRIARMRRATPPCRQTLLAFLVNYPLVQRLATVGTACAQFFAACIQGG